MDQFERSQHAVAIEALRAVRAAERAGNEASYLTDLVDDLMDYIEGVRASRLKDLPINFGRVRLTGILWALDRGRRRHPSHAQRDGDRRRLW